MMRQPLSYERGRRAKACVPAAPVQTRVHASNHRLGRIIPVFPPQWLHGLLLLSRMHRVLWPSSRQRAKRVAQGTSVGVPELHGLTVRKSIVRWREHALRSPAAHCLRLHIRHDAYVTLNEADRGEDARDLPYEASEKASRARRITPFHLKAQAKLAFRRNHVAWRGSIRHHQLSLYEARS